MNSDHWKLGGGVLPSDVPNCALWLGFSQYARETYFLGSPAITGRERGRAGEKIDTLGGGNEKGR